MATFHLKVRPVVLSVLAVFILFTGFFYLRMDLALSNIAFEKLYKTETITYQKPNGETGRLRVLTLNNYAQELTTRSDIPVTDEKEDQESDVTLVSEELVMESIKTFLEDLEKYFLNSKAWQSEGWKAGGGKYISALDHSDKEILRNVLLELQQLRQTSEMELQQLRQTSEIAVVSTPLEDEDTWRNSSSDVGMIDEDSAEVGEFKFRAHGRLNLRRLVLYSSYRSSLTEFTVVTLSPTVLRSSGGPVHNICVWLPDGSKSSPRHFSSLEEMNSTGHIPDQSGSLISLRYVNDTHGRNYDTLVIRCSFPHAVGTDKWGGFLFFNISHGLESSELVPVFHERPGKFNASVFDLKTFQYEYAYCSAPVWTNLSALYVKQWFMYHHTLTQGNIVYFIYDNIGIDEETMGVMKPFIDKGILTVINQQRERDYDAWYHTQAPAINDCINRARFLAKWVLFWDFDEYLLLPSPLTLPALLQEVEEKEAPWISFGNMWYSRAYCAPESQTGEWAVERMLYRLEKAVCGVDEIAHICEGEMGHRKWIANPRVVKLGSIHRSLDPEWGGINLDTAIARINHYRGLAAPDASETSCKIIKHPLDVNDTKVDGWWMKDDKLAVFVTGSIKNASQSFDIFQSSVPS